MWGTALSAWEIPGRITAAGRIAFVYREDYLGGALFMALPSGRLLTYPRLRWRDVDVLDKDDKPTGEKRTELSIRMTTHDEIVVEVDAARAEEAKAILRREMLTVPDWAEGLPLQSEESVCGYYTKAKTALHGGKP